MKIPWTSDWLIIGSIVMWCVGLPWYVPTIYAICGLIGKTMEKALEMQRQKETMEALEKFVENFSGSRSNPADNMSDALKSVQNLVSLFDPNSGPKTPN